MTDLASLLLSRVNALCACQTLIRWASFLGDVGPGQVNADGGKVAVQILEDAFATGQASPHIVEEVRSWHYRLAQYPDPATGSKVSPKDRIAHLGRILELGFTFGYIYKLLAEAHHDLGDDEQARTYLKKAFEVDPNVSGTVRLSRALGFFRLEKSARPQRNLSNRAKWTRPEQIPSPIQIHEWVEKENWDAILTFANPNDYSSPMLPKARDSLRLIGLSLGDCNETRAVQALTMLLHFNYYWDVSQAALASLSKIGGERTLASLEEFSARVEDGTYHFNSTGQECLKASIAYVRARLNNKSSLVTNNGTTSLLVQAERAYAKENYGQARFLLEKMLADMAGSHSSFIDVIVLLARSCAKMKDTKSALRFIKPILDNLPETSMRQILSEVRSWLWSHLVFGGYVPIYDDSFQLALNIELELALSAKTPDEVLRPLRDLTRWLEILGAGDTVQLIRQLIRTEAPGTWYVDQDDRARYLRNVMLSDDMCRFLAVFDMRIKSEAVTKLKQMMRSLHSIEPTASAIRDGTPGTEHGLTSGV